ncbi:MAG: DUF192 domain-containing protein [Planctomycetota bacterium]
MKWLTIPALLLALSVACDQAPAVETVAAEPETRAPAGEPQDLPTTQMRLGNLRFNLQIANDPTEREIGLMHVTEMGKKDGMIFVFPKPGQLSFWMEDTLIPLDIIFVDATGTVTKIAQMTPLSRDLTDSDGRCQWVIELNAGMAGEAGIKVGDVLLMPAEVRPDTAE